MADVPFQEGVQALPSAITNARLYTEGEPAESLPDASSALT